MLEVVGCRDHGRQRRHGFGGVSAELWVESGAAHYGPLTARFFERFTEVTAWIDEQLALIIVLNTGAGGLATAQALALLERPRAFLEGGGHAEGTFDKHLERAKPTNRIPQTRRYEPAGGLPSFVSVQPNGTEPIAPPRNHLLQCQTIIQVYRIIPWVVIKPHRRKEGPSFTRRPP